MLISAWTGVKFGWDVIFIREEILKSKSHQVGNSIYLHSLHSFWKYLFFFFLLFILYWDIADEQCRDSSRWTVKRLSHTYTFCVRDFDPMTPSVGNKISVPFHCSELCLCFPVWLNTLAQHRPAELSAPSWKYLDRLLLFSYKPECYLLIKIYALNNTIEQQNSPGAKAKKNLPLVQYHFKDL